MFLFKNILACHNDIEEYNEPSEAELQDIVELLKSSQGFIVSFGFNKYGYVKRLQVSSTSFMLSFYNNGQCYERLYDVANFRDAALDVYSFANLLYWRHCGIYYSRPVKDTVVVPYTKRPSISEVIFKRARLILDKEAVAFSKVADNAPYFFNPSESDFNDLNKSAEPPVFIFTVYDFYRDELMPFSRGNVIFDEFELYKSLQMAHNKFPSGFKAEIFKHIDCKYSLKIVCENNAFDEIPLVYGGKNFGEIAPKSLVSAVFSLPCSHGS